MSAAKRALSALGKIGILIAIGVAFVCGLAGTIYLSLRRPEVKVPDIVGKNRLDGESVLDEAGLNVRIRRTRFSPDAKPDTILEQSPQAGEVVKAGQTVAVVLSRAPREGESVASASLEAKVGTSDKPGNTNTDESATAKNLNENKIKERRSKNKNTNNKNANDNNANNSNNRNANIRSANDRNANNLNVNDRNGNNRNANVLNRNLNVNRNGNNANANRRAPVISTPPFVPNSNTRRP